jgi:release factor glutamine methyltransferase
MIRKLMSLGLKWRFWLFQRHRYGKLVIEQIEDCSFVALPDVFNPALFFSSKYLAKQLPKYISADTSVLDMGTGSGVCAVIAARYTKTVTAIDVNPEAVRCARINALLNQVEDRIRICEGDLFSSVRGERFDVILFNPPYFRGEPQDNQDKAWRSNDVIERFSGELRDYLNPGGYGLVILSTNGDLDSFLSTFQSDGLKIESIANRNIISETLTVFKLSPEN